MSSGLLQSKHTINTFPFPEGISNLWMDLTIVILWSHITIVMTLGAIARTTEVVISMYQAMYKHVSHRPYPTRLTLDKPSTKGNREREESWLIKCHRRNKGSQVPAVPYFFNYSKTKVFFPINCHHLYFRLALNTSSTIEHSAFASPGSQTLYL